MSNPLLTLGIVEPDPFPVNEAPTPRGDNHHLHRTAARMRRLAALTESDQLFVEHILDCIERRNVSGT